MAGLGDKVVARMQNRRGNRVNLPQPLEPGEIGWCLDTRQLFIGINEENAIPSIEVYPGTGHVTLAQSIIDDKIVEFSTPYLRVDTSTTINSIGTTSEVDLISALKEIPVSSFLVGNTRAYINQLESQVGFINSINNTLAFSNVGNFPYISLYDWTENSNTVATASITESGGVIDNITVIFPGLGYSTVPVVTITDSGPGINAVGTAVIDGGGLLQLILSNQGTGYSVNDVLVVSGGSGTGAQITVTSVSSGAITGFNVTTPGTGYSITDTGLTVTGPGNDDAVFDVVNVSYGTVTSVTITNGGSGYTNPSISIAAPVTPTGYSSTIYKFTYHVGIEDQNNGTPISTVDFETFMSSIQLNPLIVSPGELGDNLDNTNLGKGNIFISNSFTTASARQAGNIAGLINKIAATDVLGYSGIVNSKQNVEILTELTSSILGDIFIQYPISYELPASATFVQIENDMLSPFDALPLEYSSVENDVQIIDYSLFADEGAADSKLVRTGKLRVVTVDGSTDLSLVDDDYIENRGAGITPVSSSGPDFDFRATFDAGLSTILVEYRHDFTNRVTLRFTTRRWNSF